jgi:Right handed beta helix region
MLAAFGATQSVDAMETEVALNQDVAMMGGVTPGDVPGFPITITRPGRYVLTSNLYPDFDKVGIEVQAYDVTIDFNGFILHGNFQQAMVGIHGGSVNTVKIMNGLIAGFGTAIYGKDSWVVENMRISANSGTGVHLFDFARVQRNTITLNHSGIRCADGCLVEGNVISQNGIGVEINTGTVLGNTITSNSGVGIKAWATVKSPIAFGNNLLHNNNNQGAQVDADKLIPLQPNACLPSC